MYMYTFLCLDICDSFNTMYYIRMLFKSKGNSTFAFLSEILYFYAQYVRKKQRIET